MQFQRRDGPMRQRKTAKERDTQLKRRELAKTYMLTLLKELKKKKKPKPQQLSLWPEPPKPKKRRPSFMKQEFGICTFLDYVTGPNGLVESARSATIGSGSVSFGCPLTCTVIGTVAPGFAQVPGPHAQQAGLRSWASWRSRAS